MLLAWIAGVAAANHIPITGANGWEQPSRRESFELALRQ